MPNPTPEPRQETEPDTRSESKSKRTSPALIPACFLFFLAGAAALILEILWTRQLELLLGNTVYAATTMAAIFMAGLGLGAWLAAGRLNRGRIPAPLKTFAAIEVGILAWAFIAPLLLKFLHLLFPPLSRLLAFGGPVDGTPTLLRVIGAVLIFTPATILMGASLPVLAHAVARRRESFSTRLSILYGSNVLGAMTGALLAGFVLLPASGTILTNAIAAALSLIAAFFAFLLARTTHDQSDQTDRSDPAPSTSPLPGRIFLVTAAFSGGLALYLQVFWLRALIPTFGATTYAFSTMLVLVLAGAALGPLLFGWLADRKKPADLGIALIALCFFAAGLVAIITLYGFDTLPSRFWSRLASHDELSWTTLMQTRLFVGAQIIFLPSFFLGAIAPLSAKAFRDARDAGAGISVSHVFLWNAAGAAAGILVGGFLALPLAGLDNGFFLGGAACIILSLVVILTQSQTSILRIALPLVTIFLVLLWYLFPPPRISERLALGAQVYSAEPGKKNSADPVRELLATSSVVVFHEGVAGNAVVLRNHDETLRFFSDGRLEASTGPQAMIAQGLLGHLGMLLHPADPKRVLDIGLGGGVTAGAITQYPGLEALHAVDVVPASTLAAKAFIRSNHNVLAHPSLTLFYNDARNHLLVTPERYDVICSDPSDPTVPGAAPLFTREFFRLARHRLADGGVFCQRVPMGNLSPDDFTLLVATFTEVFPNTLCFTTGADFILVGYREDIRIDIGKSKKRLRHLDVASSLNQLGFTQPAHVWGLLVADFQRLKPTAPDRLNTDSRPLLEFQTPRTAPSLSPTAAFRDRKFLIELLATQQETSSSFIEAFPAPERTEIFNQQSALYGALQAGYAFGHGDLDTALEAVDQAFVLAPKNPIVSQTAAAIYFAAGNAALSRREETTAALHFKKAHEAQPREFKFLHRLTLACLRAGDHETALPLLNKGVELYPNSPYFFSLYGSLQFERGELENALALHRLAVSKAPLLDHLWLQYNLVAQATKNKKVIAQYHRDRLEFRGEE